MYRLIKTLNLSRLLLIHVLLFSQATLYAQKNTNVEDLFKTAKNQLAAKNYNAALKTCDQALAIDSLSKDVLVLKSQVYGQMNDTDKEILYLNKAGMAKSDWDVVFRLGEAYFKKENYSEALRYYNIYSDMPRMPEKRQFLLACKISSCKFLMHSNDENNFWPLPTSDGNNLFFVNQNASENREAAEEVPETDLWKIYKLENDTIPYDNEGIHKLNDGLRILFFTACNREDGIGDCDIYFVKRENGKWGNPVNAGSPVNSESWDAQASYYPQKKLLFFVSDRSGGLGKKDIWRTELLGFEEDGKPRWRTPVNLGDKVNTRGNETAPFINVVNNNLYFASDNLPGLGGIDLFNAELNETGNVVNVTNLGYPINTHFDDDDVNFSHVSDSSFFTSSRQTNKGQQIYAFNFDRGVSFAPVAYVKLNVKDAISKKPLETSVKLEFQPFHPRRFQMQETNENGESVFSLRLNRNYAFTISEPGYLFASKFLNLDKTNSVDKPEELTIELQPIEIGAEVQLYNINFETDSFRILSDSYSELQKISTFLNNNKGLKVEIQGHTDSSGNADYNQGLSERRAKSVVDYLAGQGISISRLKYMGYGDKNPVASNETEEGRMLNRRTTIKIIEK